MQEICWSTASSFYTILYYFVYKLLLPSPYYCISILCDHKAFELCIRSGFYLMLKKNSVNQKSSDVLFLPMKLERITRFIRQLHITKIKCHRRFLKSNYTPYFPSTSSPEWNSSNESQTHVCGNLWSASSHWWSKVDKQLLDMESWIAIITWISEILDSD